MSKSSNPVKDAIKAYLDKRASEDELFAKFYSNPNKSIDECFQYVTSEAFKAEGETTSRCKAVYMDDDYVYGLAVHYYNEENIKIEGLPSGARCVTAPSTPQKEAELSEEEKKKAHSQAMAEYKKKCIAQMEEEAKKLAEKRAKRQAKREDVNQLSLFD